MHQNVVGLIPGLGNIPGLQVGSPVGARTGGNRIDVFLSHQCFSLCVYLSFPSSHSQTNKHNLG